MFQRFSERSFLDCGFVWICHTGQGVYLEKNWTLNEFFLFHDIGLVSLNFYWQKWWDNGRRQTNSQVSLHCISNTLHVSITKETRNDCLTSVNNVSV